MYTIEISVAKFQNFSAEATVRKATSIVTSSVTITKKVTSKVLSSIKKSVKQVFTFISKINLKALVNFSYTVFVKHVCETKAFTSIIK